MKGIRTGIVGVTGYAGQEILRILLGHPRVRLNYLASSGSGDPSALLRHFGDLPAKLSKFSVRDCADRCDSVFLALPHEVSMENAPALLANGVRVFDLSAAFRLKDPADYAAFYAFRHSAPALLKQAVYGLPECAPAGFKRARLIAVPGCYPTGALIPLAPLLGAKLLAGQVHIDSKSGVTGAGRDPRPDLVFSEVNESMRAYGVFSHRHTPEIGQELARAAGKAVDFVFVPHLAPMNRGILTTIYAGLRKGVTAAYLASVIRNRYRGRPFVRISEETQPETRRVKGTNFIDICVKVRGRTAVITSAIDNLGKGAAGQAVQAFNVCHGLPEDAGLGAVAGAP